MQVGDLVRLSSRKTRRGIGYEEQYGVVLEVRINRTVTVNFSGLTIYLAIEDVEVISESG